MNIPIFVAFFAGIYAGSISHLDVSDWWYFPCVIAVLLALALDRKK